MKKILALLLGPLLLFNLVACSNGTNDSNKDNQSSNYTQQKENQNINNANGGDKDDSNELITFTVSADIVGEGATQEQLDAGIAATEGIESVVLNDDGSATYTMTKAAHAEMLTGLIAGIDEGIEEMLNSEEYSFTAIDHNDDYTKFTVTTEDEELGFADSLSVMDFYMFGGMYASFNGVEVDNIEVVFVNATTGEIIETANSSDIAE